jgi:hypothetical protein
MAQGPKHEAGILQKPRQKMDKKLYLNHGEDDVKGTHA